MSLVRFKNINKRETSKNNLKISGKHHIFGYNLLIFQQNKSKDKLKIINVRNQKLKNKKKYFKKFINIFNYP